MRAVPPARAHFSELDAFLMRVRRETQSTLTLDEPRQLEAAGALEDRSCFDA
jgi:hypothetical protein